MKIIASLVVLVIISGLIFFLNERKNVDKSEKEKVNVNNQKSNQDNQINDQDTDNINNTISIFYTDGKTIVPVIFDNSQKTVTFIHPETRKVVLPAAISGSGARYTNNDESLVFWEHNGEVTIIKNGKDIFKGKEQNESNKQQLTKEQARVIAEEFCSKNKGKLTSDGTYNENSKTWWFDAIIVGTKKGCNPSCVVNAETKAVEINWRCTGLLP